MLSNKRTVLRKIIPDSESCISKSTTFTKKFFVRKRTLELFVTFWACAGLRTGISDVVENFGGGFFRDISNRDGTTLISRIYNVT